jgi:S-adenosyl methyltransferase
VEAFDTTRPNIARVWDYWLGGKDNFAADRELARKMLELYPPVAEMARENRQFLHKAVTYVAGQGIGQFIDVGAGLPTAVNTHDVASQAGPDAKVAYVDNDPVVLTHARALLAQDPDVIALHGDLRDPQAILTDPGLNRLINWAKPVCVLLCGVLHFLEASHARRVAAAFTLAIPAGSYLVISVGTGKDDALSDDFKATYSAAPLYFHSPSQILTFFGSLELVPPGLVPARGWEANAPLPELEPRHGTFYAGVGHKP